jgi:hypothetical protein
MSEEDLEFHNILPPQSEVPVFNCVVHITTDDNGLVFANVANLSGIQCQGNSQRDALSKIVPLFKQRVGALHRSGEAIPWIETETPSKGTQELHVPVHL